MEYIVVLLGIIISGVYFALGIGVARVSAKAKGYSVKFSDFIFWPLALLIWAITGDIRD